MGVSCHLSPTRILSGELGKRIPAPWGESHPRADESCEVCGSREGREKPNEIIIGFSNQFPMPRCAAAPAGMKMGGSSLPADDLC